MNSNDILTGINTDNTTGIDGLDNMDRTAIKIYSSWSQPLLPKSAVIALLEIKAKLVQCTGDAQTTEESDTGELS